MKTAQNITTKKNGAAFWLSIFCATCLFVSPLQSILVVGDPDAASGNTFSFNVGFAKFTQMDAAPGKYWLASGQTITTDDAKPFALSYVQQFSAEPSLDPETGIALIPAAIPMASPGSAALFSYNSTTQKVDTTTAPNPFYGAQFSLFDIFTYKPVCVMQADITKLLYAYDIRYSPNPTETTGPNKTEILLYDFAAESVVALAGASDSIYTASTTGTFGTSNSYISNFILTSEKKPEQKKEDEDKKKKNKKEEEKPEPRLLPYLQLLAKIDISTATNALTTNGGTALASLGSSITLRPSITGLLFAGVQATAANTTANDCAAGVMLVNTLKTVSGEFILEPNPIATDSVLRSGLTTVISAPRNESIRIKNIALMSTSTSLDYIIVARDQGTGPQTIYAAPIVTTPTAALGQIADCTKISNAFNQDPPTFAKRTFTTALTDATQIDIGNTTAFSKQIAVGSGALPLASGNIQNLYTVGDSVYVVLGSAYAANTAPGTFQSQAIFAQDGHIIGWSPWSRVLATDKPMLASYVSPNTTANFYVSDPSGAGTNFNTVIHTQWTINANLAPLFQSPYLTKGMTQGVFNFSQATPGFNNAMSLFATTGFNQVTLAQTGSTPAPNEFKIVSPLTTSNIVSFDNIVDTHALVALELAHNTNTNLHWLFAGGANGLYVLTDNTTGYTHSGNFTSVSDFNAGQTWKEVGNFSYVKKIVWDQTYIYVLTPQGLYQIELAPEKFMATPTMALSPAAMLISLPNTFFLTDVIVDQGFCILGTTMGLLQATIEAGRRPAFAIVPIPDGLPTIAQLFVVSDTAEPQRNFKTLSNLLVLNNNFATQQARLNRFAIVDGTITPFNDSILNSTASPTGVPTSFVRFSQYITNYFTDGSWNLASNYYLGLTQPSYVTSPSLLQMYASIRNGRSSSQSILHTLSAYVPTQFLNGVNLFLGISRETTSGSYIASGNFQARINA